MSFTERKREEIRKYLLRKISLEDPAVIEKTMDAFGISVTTVKRYIRELLDSEAIRPSASEGCPYALVSEKHSISLDLDTCPSDETILCREHIEPFLSRMSDNAIRIWQYACMEILNNALEHSHGKELSITVVTNALNSTVVITDDGRGAFRTLLDYMSSHGWENPRIEDALVELYKGKITCDSEHHSGEGIFFTSKLVDRFILWSEAVIFKSGSLMDPDIIKSHLAMYASRIERMSTTVIMQLENETDRISSDIFNTYADIDDGFIRTVIPVKAACLDHDPVSRSQARRICTRLTDFKEVTLDFNGTDFMGQGFSDEIFRVYAKAHPEITLRPVNLHAFVLRMIKHVARGDLPANVILPST